MMMPGNSLTMASGWRADPVATALHWVAGDATQVEVRAKSYRSVTTWRMSQTAQATSVMAAAGIGPLYVSVPASLAASVWVVRKMAHSAWGVGVLMGAEVRPVEDFLAVLGLWVKAPVADVKRVCAKAGTVLKGLFPAGLAVASLSPATVGGHLVEASGKKLREVYGEKLLERINLKLLKEIMGYRILGGIPVAGIAVNAGVSWYAVRKFASCAEDFYARRLRGEL